MRALCAAGKRNDEETGVDTGVIAELLHPFADLQSQDLSSISKYIDLLTKWNSRMNLTAVRDPHQMATRHFGESFFAAKSLIARDWRGLIVDVGSGAGFPGIPLAVWAGGAQVGLIESNAKKAAFLNQVIRTLELKNAKVFLGRAEIFAEHADMVTMRAVERFENVLPMATGHIKPGGRIGLMIGAAQVGAARELCPKLEWADPIVVPGGHSRVLLAGIRNPKVDPE